MFVALLSVALPESNRIVFGSVTVIVPAAASKATSMPSKPVASRGRLVEFLDLPLQFVDRLLILRDAVRKLLPLALEILESSLEVLVLDVEIVVLLLVVRAAGHQGDGDKTNEGNDRLPADQQHAAPPCNTTNPSLPRHRPNMRLTRFTIQSWKIITVKNSQ